MGYRLMILGMLFIGLCSCKAQNDANSTLTQKRNEDWRKIAFCTCIYKATPFTSEMKRQEGTISGYLQKNEDLNIEQLDEVQSYVKRYLENENYQSKTNSSLALMKCIDFYESEELKQFISELDN